MGKRKAGYRPSVAEAAVAGIAAYYSKSKKPKTGSSRPVAAAPKGKGRGPGSKTQTKKKQRINMAKSNGQETYSSSFRLYRKPKKLFKGLKKAVVPNWYYTNSSGRLDGAVGLQTPFCIAQAFRTPDIQGLFNRTTMGNAGRIMIEDCLLHIRMQNQSLTYADITIYDIIAFRDMATNETGPTKDATYPDNAWNLGVANEGIAGSPEKIIGMIPTMSQQFRSFYRILKTTKARVPSGWVHEHTSFIAPNKYMNRERITLAGGGDLQNVQGLTYYCMIVVNGGIANDSTTKSQVSTVAPHIDYLVDQRYKWSYIQDANESAYTPGNTIPTAFTVNPEFVNEGANVVVSTDAPA